MRIRYGAAAWLVGVALTAAGCQTGGGTTAGTDGNEKPVVVPKKLPPLAQTPDVNTPPATGRFTLNLITYITGAPGAGNPDGAALPGLALTAEEEERRTHQAALTTANALRDKNIPAFVLRRTIRHRAEEKTDVPVFQVCVGAFDNTKTDEARGIAEYFRRMVVRIGNDPPKVIFRAAQFVVLSTRSIGDADDLLSLYEMGPNDKWGVVVALFQGPDNKALAQQYAIGLRKQGYSPLIQNSEVASRVILGTTEFNDDPKLAAICRDFPRVKHNMIGYVSFRGRSGGKGFVERAAEMEYDCLERKYDVFSLKARIRPDNGPADVTIEEARVFVVQKPGESLAADDLKRRYSGLDPYGAEDAEYRTEPTDLRDAAWNKTNVRNPEFRPGPGTFRPRG